MRDIPPPPDAKKVGSAIRVRMIFLALKSGGESDDRVWFV